MFFTIFNACLSIICGLANGLFFIFGLDFQNGNISSSLAIKGILIGFATIIIVYLAINFLELLFFVIIALCIPKNKDYNKVSPAFSKIFIGFYSFSMAFFRVRLHVSGIEQVPFSKDDSENNKFLAVCNHRSGFDCFAMAVALKKEPIAFITKPENYNIPVAHRYMRRGLYLSIDRDDVRKALLTIMKGIDFIASKVVSIGVFPEGTRTKDGKLGTFKPGCLKIAEKTECPIVVCTVQGTEKVMKNFPFKKTDVYFDVIKVISQDSFSDNTTVDISDDIRKLMLEKLGE